MFDFIEGDIENPEVVNANQFRVDRQFNADGTLKWLIVAALTKNDAGKEAKVQSELINNPPVLLSLR